VNSQFLAPTLARHRSDQSNTRIKIEIEDQAYPHQGEACPCFRITRKFRMV
jgi:hypothetical protein